MWRQGCATIHSGEQLTVFPPPPSSAPSSVAKTKYSNQVPRGVNVFTMWVVAEEGEDASQAM